MGWTTDQPTKAGVYLIAYKGYKSKRRRVELVEIGWRPENYGWAGPRCLAFVRRIRPGWTTFDEIRWHPDNGIVLWSKEPIPFPTQQWKDAQAGEPSD